MQKVMMSTKKNNAPPRLGDYAVVADVADVDKSAIGGDVVGILKNVDVDVHEKR